MEKSGHLGFRGGQGVAQAAVLGIAPAEQLPILCKSTQALLEKTLLLEVIHDAAADMLHLDIAPYGS